MRRSRQVDVWRALALAGIFTFLWSCARSCLLPFLTLYLRRLGLTPVMTGIVLGTRHLVTLVWSPVASLLSKRYNKRRVVILCSVTFSAAVALVVLLIPSTAADIGTNACNKSDLSASSGGNLLNSTGASIPALTHQNNQSVVTFSSVSPETQPPLVPSNYTTVPHNESLPQMPQNFSVDVKDNSSSVVHPVTQVRIKRSQLKSEPPHVEEEGLHFDFLNSLKMMDSQHQLFFLVLIIISVWEFASAPLDWTADDGLYEYLDSADAADRYSSTRLWGLLGGACGVGGAGLLVSQLSCLIADKTHRSVVHFYCYAAVAALTLPVAGHLPLYLNKKRDRPNGLLKAVQLVRGSVLAVLCAVTTLLVGVASSAVDDFLLWQMQDQGSNELHMGLSLSLALLSQTAFPLLAGRLSKLLSPGRILTLGAAGLGLQCFYYSFLWGPWAVLPAQVLSCLSSGAFWWAVRVQCEDVATPGAERSVSRVYSALCLHLGRGLGSFVGGAVVQKLGLSWLFRGVAIALMLWCVFLPLLQCKAPKQRRINYSRLLAADASEASDSGSDQERDWLDKAIEDDRSNNNNGHYGRRMNHWTD